MPAERLLKIAQNNQLVALRSLVHQGSNNNIHHRPLDNFGDYDENSEGSDGNNLVDDRVDRSLHHEFYPSVNAGASQRRHHQQDNEDNNSNFFKAKKARALPDSPPNSKKKNVRNNDMIYRLKKKNTNEGGYHNDAVGDDGLLPPSAFLKLGTAIKTGDLLANREHLLIPDFERKREGGSSLSVSPPDLSALHEKKKSGSSASSSISINNSKSSDLFSNLLEKNFECPVCLETLCGATTLPCSHTYCRSCIQQIKEHREECGGWFNLGQKGSSASIVCPLCREDNVSEGVRIRLIDNTISDFVWRSKLSQEEKQEYFAKLEEILRKEAMEKNMADEEKDEKWRRTVSAVGVALSSALIYFCVYMARRK